MSLYSSKRVLYRYVLENLESEGLLGVLGGSEMMGVRDLSSSAGRAVFSWSSRSSGSVDGSIS